MKMILLVAAGALIGAAFSQIAEGASSSNQSATTEIRDIPSIKAAQAMIMGDWDNSGPNPSTTRITQNTLWNSRCWTHYKILDVRAGRTNKTTAYIVVVDFGSAGGPGECGHSNEPSFGIALIPADGLVSGKATTIYWLNCNSEKDIQAALQYQDPRDSNAVCSSYVSSRSDRG